MSNVDPSLVLSIAHRLNDVQALISSACHEANRAPSSVALLAVTKTHTAEVVAAAYAAGLRDFGENYVQEGADKIVAGLEKHGFEIAPLLKEKAETKGKFNG